MPTNVTTTTYTDSDIECVAGYFSRAHGALCTDGKRRTVHAQGMKRRAAVSQLAPHFDGFVYVGRIRVRGTARVCFMDAWHRTVKFLPDPTGRHAHLLGSEPPRVSDRH
jgi:hypothetical protein